MRSKTWLRDNSVFCVTLLIALCVIVLGYIFSGSLGDISSAFMRWVSHYFGWLYILSIIAFIMYKALAILEKKITSNFEQ